MRIPLAVVLLLLAGCGTPTEPDPAPIVYTPTVAPDRDHDLTVRVSQERADGPAMPGVEVQVFLLDEAGTPGTAIGRSTNSQGFATFTFEDPVRVAVRATAPGWTREGVVLLVGDGVAFDQVPSAAGIHVASLSERDLFLPLFRSQLDLATATSLMTATVEPAPDGSLRSPVTAAALDLPEGLEAAYLARVAAADVRLHWEDTASSRAHLSAALAWDGTVWVRGEATSPGVLPGPREALFTGPLPAEGRPADLASATLQAAAILESAAVGDVPVSFEVRLAMTGFQPAGLPADCHLRGACLVPLPSLPPLP